MPDNASPQFIENKLMDIRMQLEELNGACDAKTCIHLIIPILDKIEFAIKGLKQQIIENKRK